MKITKTHLTKLIKEEIAKSIEEAEVVQEVYFPFIGGKLPDGEWSIRRKQMKAIDSAVDDLSEEEQLKFAKLNKGFLNLPDDQSDWFRTAPSALSDALEEKFEEFNEQLKKLSYNRHKKDEADYVMSKMDGVLDRMSKVAGGVAQQIADEKAEDAADKKRRASEKAERDAAYEKERKAQGAHDEEQYWNRKDADREQGDRDYEKRLARGGNQSNRLGWNKVNQSTSMGYGESLDRKKISKSKLAQIIKEELENLLK